jgi:DNA-binding transcriptional ArsR family regulator
MEPRYVELDARLLRGLAHPLRGRMLGILRTEGPATASGLAARLGESSGTTSWHLRQLAELGFIVQDTERGNRRERWWRAAHEFTTVRAERFLDDPDTADALDVFQHELVSTYYRHAAGFVAQARTWSRDWVEASGLSDVELPLTPEELTELRDELHAVVLRYRREARPGDEAVTVQLQLFPRRRS